MKSPTALIELPLRDGTVLKLNVNVVPEITGEIQRLSIDIKLLNNHLLKELPLADKLPTGHENSKIDLLIGNDYYLEIIENQVKLILRISDCQNHRNPTPNDSH